MPIDKRGAIYEAFVVILRTSFPTGWASKVALARICFARLMALSMSLVAANSFFKVAREAVERQITCVRWGQKRLKD